MFVYLGKDGSLLTNSDVTNDVKVVLYSLLFISHLLYKLLLIFLVVALC